MIQPGQIPQFTGDLTQLETDYAALKTDAGNVRSVGTKVHNQFQGLSAYYQAPEAEKLFATTQVVKDKADTFADGLETVSSALSSYASEIRPLVERLKQLKTEATEFVASVKDDDEWEYDGDKVEEHNRIRDDITATVAAFWAAERTCHNKITALWGGTQMVAGDGSERKDQYGFDAGDMKNAKLPWGDPVEEKHHWYEVGHWVKSFVWDGLIVDGVWGTIKGLGTLVGFGGWEAMKQAWTGLAQLATGLVISAVPVAGALFWTLPDDRLPSWIRDSRTAMKETGKALVAWDEWGKNPARAAGAVTFNVLTTVFTGGAGGAVAGAGKAGAVAKVLGTAGRAIDPMTYIAKGAGAGLSKIGDIATALKGVGTIDIPPLPANAFELPPGTVRLPDGTFDLPAGTTLPDGATRLPDGNVRLPEQTVPVPEGSIKLPTEDGAPARYLDPQGNLLDDTGTVVQRADQAPREPGGTDHGTPADADTPHTPTPVREPALVGAGATDNAAHAAADGPGRTVRLGSDPADTLGDAARTGDNTTPPVRAGTEVPPIRAGAEVPPIRASVDEIPGGNAADNLPTGRAGGAPPAGSLDQTSGTRPSTVHDLPGTGGTDALPGPRGPEVPTGGLDDIGRAGDDAFGTGGDDMGRAGDGNRSGPSGRDSADSAGGRDVDDAARRREVMDEQVRRANEEPGYFEDYYKSNGNRKSLEVVDESGTVPPQLTRQSPNHPWVAVKDAPAPLAPRFLGDWDKVHTKPPTPEAVAALKEAAEARHQAVQHDTAMRDAKAEARAAHEQNPTPETLAEKVKAEEAYREAHIQMRDHSEAFGEAVAEHHVIPERYQGATREPLDGPKNGNDQFDQVWRRADGGYVVVEAKSSVTTELGARNLPSGQRVSQGTREYFLDIIREMRKRGENNPAERALARNLMTALRTGKLDYIVVKGEKNTGEYAGYHTRQFDISDRSIP